VISALLIKATLEQLSSSDPSSSPAIEDSIAMPSSQTLIDCSLVAGTMVLGINYLRAGWRIFRQADNGWNRLSGIQPLVLGLSFLKSRPKIRLNPDFLEGAVCAQLVSQKIYQERRCFAPWNQKKNPDQCSLDQEFTPNRFPRQSNTTPCCNMSYREWKIPQLHCMTDKMMENHWLYSKMPSLAKKILFTYPSY
jgi:hypothetical protein